MEKRDDKPVQIVQRTDHEHKSLEVSMLEKDDFSDEELESYLSKGEIKATDKVTIPPKILFVGDCTIATFGNFSASTGKAKSKKTFNISAMVAAAVTNTTVLNYRACLPEGKRKILYFDTEQSKYHCHNGVGTLIVTLRLARLSAEDIIYLKHAFYKRSIVDIVDFDISGIADRCTGGACFGCIAKNANKQHLKTTIQDYVNEKFRKIGHYNQLEYDVDFRARYSFVELTMRGRLLTDGELYGIILADEGFQYVPKAVYGREIWKDSTQNISTRKSYDFYMNGLNAILVYRNLLKKVRCNHDACRFGDDINFNRAPEFVETEQLPCSCLPGLQEDFFPAYLKAVEVHYLVNKVNTNEIAVHERSFLKPWIFLKRLFLLWEILYELDTHKYHIHKTFVERFGINKELETIRAEYNSLLTHAMSYFNVIIAIFAAILTVLQLWK